MQYHEIPAPAPLDRWVRCFWFLRVDGGGFQPVVPDGRLEIVLHLAEPFGMVQPDGSVRDQVGTMVSGQLTRPIVLAPRGHADIIGIRFRTAAARDILSLPLVELDNLVVPLRDLDVHFSSALDRAARGSDPVRALCTVLFDRVREHSHSISASAVARLARGENVAHVARALHTSARTLERRVRDDTGLPPKLLQQVMRFRVLYALLQTSRGKWARAAASAGYYDQTHANRDFRRFAGASPSEHFAHDPVLARALLAGGR